MCKQLSIRSPFYYVIIIITKTILYVFLLLTIFYFPSYP